MKKILVIEPSGKLYGSEMVLFDIIKNCNPEKYNFTIILPTDSPFCKVLKENHYKYIDILNISSRFEKLWSYFKLFNQVQKLKPDLIFVNQAGIQKIISIIANKLQIPVVSEVSTLEDGQLVNAFHKKLLNPVKSFICNSEFIANQLQVPTYKKSILYYGYEWKNLTPPVPDTTNPFKLALLGRISESKGHFLLVESVKYLKQNRPDINIEIHFIGDAPSLSIEKSIKENIENNQMQSLFHFKGFDTNINKALSGMNMMIIPSIQEPFGRIFCESAEANLPCIVADTGGLGELSIRFNLGERFEGKNPIDLGEKIAYCYDNYSNIKTNYQKLAHSFLHKLDKEEYIKSIELVFDAAINNKDVAIHWLGSK